MGKEVGRMLRLARNEEKEGRIDVNNCKEEQMECKARPMMASTPTKKVEGDEEEEPGGSEEYLQPFPGTAPYSSDLTDPYII
jgi:hypothetical protein